MVKSIEFKVRTAQIKYRVQSKVQCGCIVWLIVKCKVGFRSSRVQSRDQSMVLQ